VRRTRIGRLLMALALVLVFVVVVVVIVGELIVRPRVEDEIAKGLTSELELTETPDVHVEGFPLVLHALQEKLDGIDISIDGQVFEGLRVQAVELHIEEVRFASSELLRGTGTVVIVGGDGRADVADADLTAYLASVGLPADVRFDGGMITVAGIVEVEGTGVPASVSGELVYDGARLRFTPTTVDAESVGAGVDLAAVEASARQQFAFTAPVPVLRGVQLTDVQVGDGIASIGAVFDSLTFEY
jgi:hypothetical protein